MASGKVQTINRDNDWITATKEYDYSGNVFYRKWGNIVTIIGTDLKNIQSGEKLVEMPSGYRPSKELRTVSVVPYPAYDAFGMVRLYTGGSLQIAYTGTFPSSGVSFCLTYIV